MNECQCCGQTLPPDGPQGLKLTARERRIYEIVRRAGQNGIKTDIIFDRVYSEDSDGGPDTQTKIISVFVCGLNKKLSQVGWRIKSGDWGGRHSGFATYALVRMNA